MKHILKKISIALTIFIGNMQLALAQLIIPRPETLPGPREGTQTSIRATKSFFESQVFGNITQFLISFVAVGTLLFVIVSGIRMMMAYGNDDEYTKAKNMFLLSILGLAIALLSYAVVSIVANLQFTNESATL